MTLSPAWLDELRARTVLSAVIAPTVKLLRAGREWKACCPFHNEKTPSFTVNDDKGFYHCFGCCAHGDAIRFLTDQRGMPFMDAVKELASKAGMDVPAPDPKAKERADRAVSLTEVMGEVATWDSVTLMVHTDDGIMEFTGPIPPGQIGGSYFNLMGAAGFHGHVTDRTVHPQLAFVGVGAGRHGDGHHGVAIEDGQPVGLA